MATLLRGTSHLFIKSSGAFQRTMSSQPLKAVRLVLLDVFDTLCTPRLPIHEQYHEEAILAGIDPNSISPQSIRNAFKPVFRDMDKLWPLYGKHAEPALKPEEWWTELIRRCIVQAGANEQAVENIMPTLAPTLLRRFESDEGYENFPETSSTLAKLRRKGVKVSIVSNADPRILEVLRSLQILPLLSHPPTLSWDVEVSKPDKRIYEKACERCQEEPGAGVIMVGDELKADYQGAVEAGLEGRLIRRIGDWSDGAMRHANEELEGVRTVSSLTDILEEVTQRQSTPR